MIISILAFLAIPSYSVLVKHVNVLPETSNERVKELNQEVIDEYNDIIKECKEYYKESFCKDQFSYILNTIYTNDELLNQTLKDLSPNTNLLHITTEMFRGTIDFNVLLSKMVVYFEGTYHSLDPYNSNKHKMMLEANKRLHEEMKKIKYDGSIMSFMKLSKSLSFKNKSIKYEYLERLSLVGDIRNKVPFITFDTVVLEVIDSDLNCENAYFSSVILTDNSRNINVTNLILEETSHRGLQLEKINVTQYMIHLRYVDSKYRIIYQKENLKVYYYYSVSQGYMDQNLDIPYTITKILGFYTTSDEIEINTDVRMSDFVFPDFNLTISGKFVDTPETLTDTLTLKTNGWGKYSGKIPKIFLAVDSDVILHTEEVESNVEIKRDTIPQYQYPEGKGDNKNNNKKIGLIVGIVVAVVAVIVIIVVVVIIVRKRKSKQLSKSEGNEDAEK